MDFNDVLLFKEISSLSEQEMRPNSVTLEDIQLSGNYQPPTLIEDPSEADENWPDDIIEGQQKPSKNSRLPRIENRTFVPDNLSKSYTHGQSDNRRSVPYSSNNKPSRNGQQQYKKPPKADYEMPKLPSLYRQNLRRN